MKLRSITAFVLLMSALLSMTAIASTIPDALTIQQGHKQRKLTLAELKRKLPVVQVQVPDPVYKTPRKFDAFRLSDVLGLLNPSPSSGAATDSGADEIVFQAADGYSPSVSRDKLVGHPAFLAFQEHGRPEKNPEDRFEKVPQGKAMISPAPFFLIWAGGKAVGDEYPWPYQLVKIELVSFKEKYSKIYPHTAGDSPEMRGFVIFKAECIRCHSVNLVGGDIGPELNIPKNVLEYWDERTLHEFVKNASSFHAKSKMPPFPNLSDSNIGDIFSYFRYLKANRTSGS